MASTRSRVKTLFLTLFIIGVFVFGIFAFRGLLFPPRVIFSTIHDGMVVPQGIIQLEGTTKRAEALFVQGRQITRNTEGDFRTEVAVFSPYTIIEVEAQDRFNKRKTYTIRLAVE